jgi:hypothetical protein
MAQRRCAFVALLALAAVGCVAAAGHSVASDGVDAIPAHLQQRELSWRRQLSSGTWQVRAWQHTSVRASCELAAGAQSLCENPTYSLQCVCTGGLVFAVCSLDSAPAQFAAMPAASPRHCACA